jgi:hypothetical protein
MNPKRSNVNFKKKRKNGNRESKNNRMAIP